MLNHTQPSKYNSGNGVDTGEDKGIYGYILIALYVLLLYIITVGFYVRFNRAVLPGGDPFTYTSGFFCLLDQARADYWGTIKMIFTSGDWYWLINFVIVLFSPILVKEPFSLSLVNFLMFYLATASFFRLARYLKFSVGFSFILALILWLYPSNYGFLTYFSVPVVALDAMFMGILYVALANMIIYAIDPNSIKNALLAGISVGLAIWGRGNSLPVVLMVIFCPLVVVGFKTKRQKMAGMALINWFIFAAIVITLGAWYYIHCWEMITDYYSNHLAFVKRHKWSLVDAMPYIKNVPGFFFWRLENSSTTIGISWISHIVTLFVLYMTFGRSGSIELYRRNALRLLAATGAFIYFSTYFINIILFTDPLMNIYNCLLIYVPMLIGLTFCLFSLLAYLVITTEIQIKQWTMIPVATLALLYGGYATKAYTPLAQPGAPSPREVELFAVGLDELLEGGSLSVLWYQHYNPNILRYYRTKNDLPEYNYYRNKYYDYLWSPHDYSEENRIRVREEIRKHFEEANFIIIPEYSNLYYEHQPYAFYKFRDEIVNYLNSPESPRFVVRMTLNDTPTARILVLQREKEANGAGEPLKLPYGPIQ